jgi:hypothetical protein
MSPVAPVTRTRAPLYLDTAGEPTTGPLDQSAPQLRSTLLRLNALRTTDDYGRRDVDRPGPFDGWRFRASSIRGLRCRPRRMERRNWASATLSTGRRVSGLLSRPANAPLAALFPRLPPRPHAGVQGDVPMAAAPLEGVATYEISAYAVAKSAPSSD